MRSHAYNRMVVGEYLADLFDNVPLRSAMLKSQESPITLTIDHCTHIRSTSTNHEFFNLALKSNFHFPRSDDGRVSHSTQYISQRPRFNYRQGVPSTPTNQTTPNNRLLASPIKYTIYAAHDRSNCLGFSVFLSTAHHVLATRLKALLPDGIYPA